MDARGEQNQKSLRSTAIEFTCHDHSRRLLVVTFNRSQVNISRASTPRPLYYCLFSPHICILLFFKHIPFVVTHISRNTTGEVATLVRVWVSVRKRKIIEVKD